MFKKIINFFLPKEDYSVSFDNKIKLKEIPLENLEQKSIFYKLNNDLGIFEITKINRNPDIICLVEVGTDNEIVIDRKLFDFLFSNMSIPKEVEF